MGDFRGHFVPGSFFIIFSISYLILILRRVVVSTSLIQYIPEKDVKVLRIGGYFVAISCTIGFIMEMVGGILYSTGPVSSSSSSNNIK